MTPLVAAALTTPVVAAAAVAAMLLVVVAGGAVAALDTIVHEGGHMVVGFLTGSRIVSFELSSGDEAVTRMSARGWGPGRILTTAAGYTAPPLLGLGGAGLLAAGRAWPLLWLAVALLALLWVKARGEWTGFVVALLAAAIGYVALYGSPLLQASFAAGLVFLLLISGVRSAATAGTHGGTDPDLLFRDTLIPRLAWKAAFVAFALYCLWKGFLLVAA